MSKPNKMEKNKRFFIKQLIFIYKRHNRGFIAQKKWVHGDEIYLDLEKKIQWFAFQ